MTDTNNINNAQPHTTEPQEPKTINPDNDYTTQLPFTFMTQERIDRCIDFCEKITTLAKEHNFSIPLFLKEQGVHITSIPTTDDILHNPNDIVPKVEEDLKRIFLEIMKQRGQ